LNSESSRPVLGHRRRGLAPVTASLNPFLPFHASPLVAVFFLSAGNRVALIASEN
jgi:hypothetical protein